MERLSLSIGECHPKHKRQNAPSRGIYSAGVVSALKLIRTLRVLRGSLLRFAEVVGVGDFEGHAVGSEIVLPVRIVVDGEIESACAEIAA